MGAQNIPAWHYAKLSELSYLPPADLRVATLPPGWRYVGPRTPHGSNPHNVHVAVFANDAERVVVGAERGTVPGQFLPDMVPNNAVIAAGGMPRGAADTGAVLRDLGKDVAYLGYDIVGAGHSEAGANSAVGVSNIVRPSDGKTRVREEFPLIFPAGNIPAVQL